MLLLAPVFGLGAEKVAQAACNLIPVAGRIFPSSLGRVGSPITAPGKTVRITFGSCDTSAGFESVAANNTVTLTFDPPGSGASTDVVVPALAVSDCTLPGGRCGTLEFVTPDTTGVLPPHGLAGPARIVVEDSGTVVVAEIGDLFQPAIGCDRSAEPIFRHFTVLPNANVFADLEDGTTTTVLATIDGGNNLLVPLDYWGGGTNSVLAEAPGSPVAIFLEGGAALPAQGGSDPNSILAVLAAQDSPSEFVRAFTLDGRPLPPLLRVKSNGELFGTADAVESVLRVARNDGQGGPDLFDVTDRLSNGGRGPILIDTFSVARNNPVPLKSIQASKETVAFARDESRETADLNADGDMIDLVVQIIDNDSGTTTNTGKAVTEVPSGFFAAPALVTSGELVAFLESEVQQGDTDLNLDGDMLDNVLRVYDRGGVELTADPGSDAAFGPLVDGSSLAISGSKIFYRNPGSFIETQSQAPGGRYGVAVSPDGVHVYVTGMWGIAVYSRAPFTGELTFVEGPLEGEPQVEGLAGSVGVALSPDGAHLYATTGFDDAIVAFGRAPSTGELTFVDAQYDGLSGVDGLAGSHAVAVSPDGMHVYAPGFSDDGIAVFSRAPSTGELTFVEAQFDGVNGVDEFALREPRGVAVSPDGAHVYTAGTLRLTAFSREPSTGMLTFVEGLPHTGNLDPGYLVDAVTVTTSRDGSNVYVAGFVHDGFGTPRSAVATFNRDASTGALTFVESHLTNPGVLAGVPGGREAVAVSPDDASVYVVSGYAAAVATFRRNPSTGALTFVEVVDGTNEMGSLSRLGIPRAVAVSPDSAQIYVAATATPSADDQVAVFGVHSRLTVFDTENLAFLPQQLAASTLVVTDERAIGLTPESADGADLNDDLDVVDQVGHLYDASTSPPKITNLGLAATRAAISSEAIALLVSEANQGSVDRNGDGDVFDDVLAVLGGKGKPPATNTGFSADAVGVSGSKIVFITSEASEGDADLNGDTDTNDRVLRVYDRATGVMTEIGQAAEEFVLGGSLVAFRTSEAAQNDTDLNGDLDTSDTVMQIYDLASDRIVNTELAAIPCSIPGCDPTIPYKINGDTVSFLTDEIDQNEDLNGDTDMDDIVLTVYSVSSFAGQLLDTVEDDASTPSPPQLGLSPFPDNSGDGTILFIETSEPDVGLDVNEDGSIDADDIVVMIAGDTDDDGTFDDFDSCVNEANGSQLDVDGDGLGDGGCDPDPVICPPAPLSGCLTPTQANKSSITVKDKLDDAKDNLKWKWVKGDATTASDFGNPAVTSNPVYSLCLYDLSASPQPLVESAIRPGGTCVGKPCWKAAGPGFKQRDKLGEPGGVQGVSFRPGAAGKAKLTLKGRGARLGLPSLPLTLPATVQLIVTERDRQFCWETTYAASIKNTEQLFKAKGP